jgi:sugar phosphate isomerase/epimerase
MAGVLRQPAERMFEVARDLGFDGVELDIRPGYERTPLFQRQERQALLARAGAAGMAIPSICLGLLNQGGFANEPEERARAQVAVKDCIALAQETDSRVLLLPFFGRGEIRSEASVQQVIVDVRTLAPMAEGAGVVLALETTLAAPELRRILDAIGSPAVQVYFDMANAVWRGYDPVAELRALRDSIAQIHVKDIAVTPGDCALGEGRVDVAACVRTISEIDYAGWLVLETPPQDDPLRAQRANLERLRALTEA